VALNKILAQLCIIFLMLFYWVYPNNTWGTYYLEPSKNIQDFFPPYAYLQFGPAPEQSVIMYFTSANYTFNNHSIEIFNPHTRIDNYSNAAGIFYNDSLQPAFDTFFLFNKLQPQIIPRMSNISIEMASISNVFVRQLSQVDTDHFIPLNGQNSSYLPSYMIPSFVKPGFYLMQLNVYFPDYKIIAHYTNTVYLTPSTNSDNSINSSLANQTESNPLHNNLSSFDSSMES